MAKIKSIYDALIKTQVKEDQCTNFLLWLLKKLPTTLFIELCNIAGLSIHHTDPEISFSVQYPLDNSRPDGVINFADSKYLILETKRFPDSFDKMQFLNHFKSGQSEFGQDNVWALFLSGDKRCPSVLKKIRENNLGRIGFISWNELLQLLDDKSKSLNKGYRILIKEMLTLAKHYKLGRIISMKNEEIKKFIDAYPIVCMYEDAFAEKLNNILNKLKDQIIIECDELVEENQDDCYENLPCIYKALYVNTWHVELSGYLFINILTNSIGILMTGYQDEKEKKKFLPNWEKKYKQKFKADKKLFAFSWIEEGDDDYAVDNGYFKLIDSTNGKLFNPGKISEFEETFYWGYIYPLDLGKIESYCELIPKDYKKLIDTFSKR